MNDKQAQKYVILIVVIIGILGLCALFTSVLNTTVTGAAVRGKIATLCKDSDGMHTEKKGTVTVFYGSHFPDQCYTDKSASQNPVNKGSYVREYFCDNNEVSYAVYYCGANDCQYGACISSQSTRVK